MYRCWYWHSHVWFLIVSLGYCLYDVVFGFVLFYCPVSCSLFNRDLVPVDYPSTVLLGALYVVNAVTYWIALEAHFPAYSRLPLFVVCEATNLLASVLYLVSQALYYLPSFNVWGPDFAAAALLQAGVYAAANLVWAVNALLYIGTFFRYRDASEEGPFWRDVEFWAELGNVVPSLGYLATSLWPLGLMGLWWPPVDRGFFDDVNVNQTQQLLVNLVWDVMFAVDAVLFFAHWRRDRDAEVVPGDEGAGDAAKGGDDEGERRALVESLEDMAGREGDEGQGASVN